VAKAQEKASEITTGIGDSHAKEKLDSVEEKVLKEEAKAKAVKNIEDEQTGTDIEKEFENLDKKTTVDDSLEALKKEMGLK
jgi:phage shock protein A